MHTKLDQPRRLLVDGCLQPRKCRVDIAQRRVQRSDAPRGNHSRGARRGELCQDPTRFRFVTARRFEMPQSERGARCRTRELTSCFVFGARFVEAAECLEHARAVRVRAVESGIKLDGHQVKECRLLVFAREVVGVANDGGDQRGQRIQAHGPLRFDEGLGVPLEGRQGPRQQCVRHGVTGIQLDGPFELAHALTNLSGVRQDEADGAVGVGVRRVELQCAMGCGRGFGNNHG